MFSLSSYTAFFISYYMSSNVKSLICVVYVGLRSEKFVEMCSLLSKDSSHKCPLGPPPLSFCSDVSHGLPQLFYQVILSGRQPRITALFILCYGD